MKNLKKIIIIITLIFIPINVLYSTNTNDYENDLIYSKQNHAIITQFAIKFLNKKYGSNFITEIEAKQIIKGNLSEDHFGKKWLIRLWNQHFYNPLKSKSNWKRSKSIDVRFERIAKRLFRKKNSKKFNYLIGEIIHHIQDVTNPAHVVPVYHGGSIKDQFDEQDISKYGFLIDEISIDTSYLYNQPYLLSVLKPTAIKTLKSIEQRFDIKVKRNNTVSKKSIDWNYFWEEDNNQWFGRYGKLGSPNNKKTKFDNYLKENIQIGKTTYIIDKDIYREYSIKQIKIAIVQTAQFIYYMKTYKNKGNTNR
jgi:hypothetical protein